EVNDSPVPTSDLKGAVEDTLLSFPASGLTSNDSPGPANESGQTLTVTAVSATSAAGGTVSLSGGVVSYTPAADYNGPDSFTYTVCDNGTTNGAPDRKCAVSSVAVTVSEVNDPPVVASDAKTTNEDSSLSFHSTDLTADDTPGPANESGQSLTVTEVDAASAHGGSVSLSAGTVLYTPAANFNGSDSFTYKVCDNGTTSGSPDSKCTTGTVNITVTAVNDPPSFTKGADQTVLEDAGAQSVPNWATAISAGPADEAGQSLNFIVSNSNNALFSSQPTIVADGTLSYTSAPDANGSALVTVRLHDSGGTANGGVDTSSAQTFTITVTEVNDSPVPTSDLKGAVEDTLLSFPASDLTSNHSHGPANDLA